MKCRLLNVAANYFILITDAQYYGLKLYKKRFGNDEWVEKQFNAWFGHGYTVNLTPKEFLTLAGLTYFGPAKHDKGSMQDYIMSAVNIATKAENELKRKRKTGPKRNGAKKAKTRKTGPKSRIRTLEEEIQVVMHSEQPSDHRIIIRDAIPDSKPGDLSEQEQKTRLIVHADNGQFVPAACLWLAGSHVAHQLSTFKWRKAFDLVSNLFDKNYWQLSETGAFTMGQAYDYFAAPWMYHPDAGAQIMEIYNTVAPLHNKVQAAMNNIPLENPLSQLTPNDLYKLIRDGSSAVSSDGRVITDMLGGTEFKVYDFIDKFMDGDTTIIDAIQSVGKFNLQRLNPARITNMVTSYLHMESENKLAQITNMIWESLTTEYITGMFKDLAPSFVKDVIEKVKEQSPDVIKIINARAALGDQKASILREKILAATSGTIVYASGTALQAYRLASNTKELGTEIKNYYSGKDSKVQHALVKMLLDGDQAYNLAYYSMVCAFEVIGATAAVGAGVSLSTIAGPASASTYMTSIVVRQAMQNGIRKLYGIEQTAEIKAVKALIDLTVASFRKAGAGIKLTKDITISIGNKFADALVGSKRKRSHTIEYENSVRETKRRLEIGDIESAVKIHEKMIHNKKYNREMMTHMHIHI